MKLQLVDVRTEQDLDLAFERARVHSEAILVLADPLFYQHRARIVSLAAKTSLPAVYTRPEFAEDGGLIGYGADFYAQYRRAAEYVDMILRGRKPGDLPIEQTSRFHLVVNLKSARELGLKIPNSVLERADQVIR